MSAKKRVKLLISGRVQGVGFRFNTKRKAKKLGVKGWVKNLDNGKVKAVAEGKEKDLEKLIEWAKKGPFTAKVTDINIEFDNYKGEFNRFKIEH